MLSLVILETRKCRHATLMSSHYDKDMLVKALCYKLEDHGFNFW
jgi:hypothetical protein